MIATALILLLSVFFLIRSRLPAELILLVAVAGLLLLDVISVQQALAGLANEGLATVVLLYIIAAALVRTGVVSALIHPLMGRVKTMGTAQTRLMLPVAFLSSLLNNTPVVAMLIPAIAEWTKRHHLSPSYFMIPLSYAAIVGGTCTLVGTSTNLVINGKLMELSSDVGSGLSDHKGLGLFELAWVGIPIVFLTVAFVVLTSRWLLPKRDNQPNPFDDNRQYMVAMEVEAFSTLAGQTIEEAGLRNLPGLYLVEIQRRDTILPAVSPTEVLCSEDVLLFAGDIGSVVDLKRFRGLRLAEEQAKKLDGEHHQRSLVEVAVSSRFPHLGKTVKESQFRNHFGAAIIAVAREGEVLKQRIGDIVLRPGDSLLLEADADFHERQKYNNAFLVVSQVANSESFNSSKAGFSLMGIMLLVGLVIFANWPMFKAAVAAAGFVLVAGCLSLSDVRNAVKYDVLLVIAASLALGEAVKVSGLAQLAAEQMVSLASGSPWLTLAAIFFVTSTLSALISNLAAAVVIYPIALVSAITLGVNPTPFAIIIMIAASASFATPIGYQTNLMVYGPGNYRFMDFVRIGGPLTVFVGVVSLILVPIIWPF